MQTRVCARTHTHTHTHTRPLPPSPPHTFRQSHQQSKTTVGRHVSTCNPLISLQKTMKARAHHSQQLEALSQLFDTDSSDVNVSCDGIWLFCFQYSMTHFLNSAMTSGNTGTTPTLTPTTLANLEQTFIDLQSVPPAHGGPQGGAAGCEPQTQSGFVPPVLDPSSREQSQDSFESDSDWEPATKRGKSEHGEALNMSTNGSSAPQRKYTRRSRHEKVGIVTRQFRWTITCRNHMTSIILDPHQQVLSDAPARNMKQLAKFSCGNLT